jgi:hypothetical protein
MRLRKRKAFYFVGGRNWHMAALCPGGKPVPGTRTLGINTSVTGMMRETVPSGGGSQCMESANIQGLRANSSSASSCERRGASLGGWPAMVRLLVGGEE